MSLVGGGVMAGVKSARVIRLILNFDDTISDGVPRFQRRRILLSLDSDPFYLLDLPRGHRDLIRVLGYTVPKVPDEL